MTCIGGAGGGGGGNSLSGYTGGTGATGYITTKIIPVEPGTNYSIVIGIGGTAGANQSIGGFAPSGGIGQNTTFGGTLVVAKGGSGGGGAYANSSENDHNPSSPGTNSISYAYRIGTYDGISVGGTGGRPYFSNATPGTAGAVFLEW